LENQRKAHAGIQPTRFPLSFLPEGATIQYGLGEIHTLLLEDTPF